VSLNVAPLEKVHEKAAILKVTCETSASFYFVRGLAFPFHFAAWILYF